MAANAVARCAMATLGGYLLSVRVGLFGFTEVRTTAGIVAGIIKVAAFASLTALALAPAAGRQPSGAGDGSSVLARLHAGVPMAGWHVVAASVGALVVLGVSAGLVGGPAPSAAGSMKTAKIGGVTVLTNAGGLHLAHARLARPPRRTATGRAPPLAAGYQNPAAGPGA